MDSGRACFLRAINYISTIEQSALTSSEECFFGGQFVDVNLSATSLALLPKNARGTTFLMLTFGFDW
jgi:hypothetical protein